MAPLGQLRSRWRRRSSVSGGAPLFDGPFGVAANITQGGGEQGFLSQADVIAAGGTIAATNTENQVIAAIWNPGEYAPGSGTLIIVADIDMTGSSLL